MELNTRVVQERFERGLRLYCRICWHFVSDEVKRKYPQYETARKLDVEDEVEDFIQSEQQGLLGMDEVIVIASCVEPSFNKLSTVDVREPRNAAHRLRHGSYVGCKFGMDASPGDVECFARAWWLGRTVDMDPAELVGCMLEISAGQYTLLQQERGVQTLIPPLRFNGPPATVTVDMEVLSTDYPLLASLAKVTETVSGHT